jgi:hypothetical protein
VKKLLLIIIGLMVALTLQACNYSTADISDVKLCTDVEGKGVCTTDSSTFKTSDTVIYLSASLDNAPEGTTITATWRYLRGEAGDEQDIDSVSTDATDSGSAPYYTSLTGPAKGWPTGDYEVVLTLSSENFEPIHKQFSVK